MIKKIFYLLLFAALFFTHNYKSAFAADFSTECGVSGCNPAITTSIFSSEKWFPLRTEIRTIQVKNTSANPRLIKVSADGNTTTTFDLAKKMTIKIEDHMGNELYGFSPIKHLFEFYLDKEYPLSQLLPSSTATYSFIVKMDDTDNDWQNRSTIFDLQLGFTEDDAPSPTPTPTPQSNPDPTNTPVPGTNPTNTPAGAASTATPTPVAGTFISYYYGGEYIDVPVLGAETSVTPKPTKTTVEGAISKKGKTLGACANPWWWWLLYLVQIVFQFIMRRLARPQNRKLVLFAQIVSGVLCGFIFSKFFCHWIFWVVSVFISLLFLYATHRKSRDEK